MDRNIKENNPAGPYYV